jgi:WD40 repeat protein
MSDVFLSYSRRDTQFVREIFELLNARKREAWIDLHDIDYSAKWWEEICSGIDGADNFVLFVSPNSLGSLFCHREIHYALEHKKRIIPFLIKQIDQQTLFQTWQNHPDLSKYGQLTYENWESIQAIQWIDFTTINDVNKAVDTLLETVDTDPERVKLHTRLLLRLRDWESRGRNPGGLLRGDELTHYEQWLTESRQKETPPHPTEEQEAYIIESRRVQDEIEEKRIQRERLIRRFRTASVVLGGFFTLAIIATALTISITNHSVNAANAKVAAGNTQVAVIGQTLTPIPPQLTAVAQTIVAGSYMIESLKLSAEANSILRTEGGNAETAALLSIRVLRKIYLSSADAALVDATHRLKAVPQVFTYQGNFSSVTFSPDGKTFLIGISGNTDSGNVELRDTASGSVIWTINIKSSGISSVTFSPDGKLVVVAAGDHTAIILDAASGNSIRVLSGHRDVVERAIFSPDGKTVLTLGGGSDRTVRLWNVETGKQIFSVPAGLGFTSLFFLPDGQSFYADDNVYNASDGLLVQNSGIGGATLAISSDGKTSLSGSNPTGQLRDTSTGQVLQSFSGHTDSIVSAAFSGDGKWLVTGSKDNTARVWEVASGKQTLLLSGNTSQVDSVAFSPDGAKVLTGSNTARLWNITNDNQQLIVSAPAGITASALAQDGKTIVIGDENGNTSLWDLNTGKLLRNFPRDSHDVKSMAFSPDGKLVAISIRSGTDSVNVNLYDPSTGELLKTFTSDNSLQPFIGTLSFSSDSNMLLVGYEDDIARLWDVSSGQVLRLIKGNDPSNRSGGITFSPDGNLVILDGGKIWWNISTGGQVKFPDAMRGNKVVFSADGSLVAIVNFDNSVSVWKVATQQLVKSFSGHTDQVKSLAFSPDNRLLLTGSADKTARSWDIASGRLLRIFTGHTASVTSVAFTPDGKKIVTTSEDKTVRTWITDYNDLLAYACTLVGVDLSPEERVLYGVSGQDPTCPQFGKQPQPLMPTTTPIPTFTPLPLWTPIATPTQGNATP